MPEDIIDPNIPIFPLGLSEYKSLRLGYELSHKQKSKCNLMTYRPWKSLSSTITRKTSLQTQAGSWTHLRGV